MTAARDSFAEFLGRFRAGDSVASREVFRRFAHRLIALARVRFGAGLRHKVDPEDVVQSAYKSFFRRYGRGDDLDVGNWNSLWGLLTLITVRKCAERVAYHRADCRDATREVAVPASGAGAYWAEALSREPTPLEAVLLEEAVDRLLSGLDEDERPIVELSLRGHTSREISEIVDRPERTVRRLRERVRARLERGVRGES
jgi:RNA polymerase sigma-70 factor (ECF subfamily)